MSIFRDTIEAIRGGCIITNCGPDHVHIRPRNIDLILDSVLAEYETRLEEKIGRDEMAERNEKAETISALTEALKELKAEPEAPHWKMDESRDEARLEIRAALARCASEILPQLDRSVEEESDDNWSGMWRNHENELLLRGKCGCSLILRSISSDLLLKGLSIEKRLASRRLQYCARHRLDDETVEQEREEAEVATVTPSA